MRKNPYSAQRRRIHAFAVAWAKADMGPGYHAHGGMARGVRVHVVTDYAVNWLAQHGAMPTGVHKARATRKIDFCSSPPTFTVDYTGLTDPVAFKKLVALRHVYRGPFRPLSAEQD